MSWSLLLIDFGSFLQVPKDECNKIPETYEASSNFETVLVYSKPNLTWDETDYRRKVTISNIMGKIFRKENFDEDELMVGFILKSFALL